MAGGVSASRLLDLPLLALAGPIGVSALPAVTLLWGRELNQTPRHHLALWKTLTIEFASTPLTQLAVTFQPDQKRLRTVKLLDRFKTEYRSPQLSLWSEDEGKWFLAWKTHPLLRQKPGRPVPVGGGERKGSPADQSGSQSWGH